MRRTFVAPWILAVTAAFALVVASTVARADGNDSDGDGVPDDIEQATQRNVAFAPDFTHGAPHSFSISSRSVGAHPDDLFRVDYEAGRFSVEYVRNAESGATTDEFSLEFSSLIEWLDENGDGQLQPSEIVGYMPLDDLLFENSTVTHQDATNGDGGRVDIFTIRTNDASLSIVVTVAQRFMRLSEDRVLTPMEIELDLVVDHTFANPAEFQGARLGLDLRLSTPGTLSYAPMSWDEAHKFSKNESWVEVTKAASSGSSSAFFSWSDLAKVDGVPGSVQVTTVDVSEPGSGEKEYDLYFAYPAGSDAAHVRVDHDPTLGVVSDAYGDIVREIEQRTPPLQADLTLYVLSLAAVAVLVAATVVLVRRRGSKE